MNTDNELEQQPEDASDQREAEPITGTTLNEEAIRRGMDEIHRLVAELRGAMDPKDESLRRHIDVAPVEVETIQAYMPSTYNRVAMTRGSSPPKDLIREIRASLARAESLLLELERKVQ